MSHGVREVKYKGSADVRHIFDHEWRAIKVEGQGTSTWDKSNKFAIPGGQFVDGAIDYFNRDDEFEVIREQSTA